MTHALKSIGNTCSVVVLLLAAAFGLNGCSDVSKAPAPAPAPPVLSPDAELSSLTVTSGTLQPAFSSNTANYTVNVLTTVTSVMVTANPQNATSTMTINGVATNPNQGRNVPLGAPGTSTPIPIVVTAQNGSQNTYVVTVTRPASSDNNLSALSVTGQTLNPAFSPTTLTYTVNVATNVASVTVSATKEEPNAVMSGSVTAPAGQATGQATINLNNPGNITPISITVTAPNGSSQVYAINVNRAAQASDNNLSALSVTGQTLSPAFAPSQISYTVAVAANVASVQVTATKSDPNAAMTGSLTAGAGQATGQATIQLGGQGTGTPVSIVVTAQNGNPKTYTIIVNRGLPSGNNNLSTLVVSAGSLTPAFAQSTTTYAVNNVPNATTTTTVTATVADATATLTINGAAAISGVAFGPIALAVGANQIPIVVTAQDGTPKTYTVTVHRAAAGNNNLSALAVSAGALTPAFAQSTTTYAVNNVPNATTTTTVTATVADATATLTINGAAAISGVAFGPIALAVGANQIPIVVTAQDGTPNTYTVTVHRNAALSNNNNLSALVVSAATPALVFAPATLNYNVTAPTGTSSTTITATLADLTATLNINSSSAISGVASPSITLVPGLNPAIPILVTAQDGTPNTYTVTITVNQ